MKGFRARKLDPIYLFPTEELPVAINYLKNLLPYLTEGLCIKCNKLLLNRVDLLDQELSYQDPQPLQVADVHCHELKASSVNQGIDKYADIPDECCDKEEDCDTHSIGSWNNGEKPDCDSDTQSIGSWKDGENGKMEPVVYRSELEVSTTSEAPNVRMSWADMAQEEDELQEYANSQQQECDSGGVRSDEKKKPELSRERREYLRFMNVQRKKDFVCLERIKGKIVNVVEGLELHTCVFSTAEQKRIVDFVFELQEKGGRGELKERTYTAPQKWMRGKGRVTIQFGCCYNYAPDRKGNPPGILRSEFVDPIPNLLKVMIRRLVQWHVLPASCVPDSCIVNIYDEGDCIPPHIDNHDFVRPFCTVSFLSECDIVFGSTLKIEGPGEFSGSCAIPLPVGSVLVLKGNGADVAKHCVPAVPSKRISITFRKMDEQKHPLGFVPEPDLQGIEPLPYKCDETHVLNLRVKSPLAAKLQPVTREGGSRDGILGRAPTDNGGIHSEPRQTIPGTHSDSGGSHSEPRQTVRGTYSDNGGRHAEPRQTIRGTYSDSGGSHSEPRQTIRGTHSDSGGSHSEPRQTTRGTYSDNDSRHPEPWQTTRGTYLDNGSRHLEPRQTTREVHSRLRFTAQTASQSEVQQIAKGTSHSESQQTSQETHSELRPLFTGTPQSEPRQTARRTPWSQETYKPRARRSIDR